MEYKIEKKKNHILVITLKGRLVAEFQTINLIDDLNELIESHYYNIVFDLSQLAYVNSSGLNFLLKILTKVRKLNGEVALCALNAVLNDLLVVTKLTSFFTICNDIEAAMAHLTNEKANNV